MRARDAKPYYRLRTIIAWKADPQRADGSFPGTFHELLDCGHKGFTVRSLSNRYVGKRGCVGCDVA